MDNNYSFISEAQNVLIDSGVKEFLIDDEEYTGGERLYSAGILSVIITPDFRAARKKIKLDAYNSGDIHHEVRPLGHKSKFTPKKYYKDLIARILRSRYIRKDIFPKSDWSIEIGFLQPNSIHRNPDGGEDISIGKLVGILLSLGYDPLRIIRRDAEIEKLQKQFAEIVVEEVNDSRDRGRTNMRRKIDAFARKIANRVKDYIRGGEKPELDEKTIRNRKWRASRETNPISYSGDSGIYEPLSESQQLEAEVLFRVTGQTEWKKLEDTKKKIDDFIESEAEKASSKITSKWKEHKQTSVARKRRETVVAKLVKARVGKISSKVTDEYELMSEQLEAETQALRAITKIEKGIQAIEYSHGRQIIATGTETYQQKRKREMSERFRRANAILKPLAEMFGSKFDLWPKDMQSKYKNVKEEYEIAYRALKAMSEADLSERFNK